MNNHISLYNRTYKVDDYFLLQYYKSNQKMAEKL